MGIKLGGVQPDVALRVEFALGAGEVGVITASAVALTRKALAQRVDEMRAETQALQDNTSMTAVVEGSDGAMAAFLTSVLKSWDVEAPLTYETVLQLVSEFPAAGSALLEAYQRAVFEGARKN